jgi:hypothetical protein
MSAKSTNSGFCALCGKRATKTKMMVHVEACAAAHDEIGQPQPLLVLRFGPVGAPRYWLIIEAKADAQLGHVDALLRQLWLECCGHRSVFRLGRREAAMTTPMATAFARTGSKVEYEYDFGSRRLQKSFQSIVQEARPDWHGRCSLRGDCFEEKRIEAP